MGFKQLGRFIREYSTDQRSESLSSEKSMRWATHTALDFIRLVHCWPDIVGDFFAKNLKPLSQERGALVLLASHPAVSQEARFFQAELIEKIKTHLPRLGSTITHLRFVTSAKHFHQKYEESDPPTPEVVAQAKLKARRAELLHPYCPRYRELKQEALKVFVDVEDEEIKNLMVSMYIQSQIDKQLEQEKF